MNKRIKIRVRDPRTERFKDIFIGTKYLVKRKMFGRTRKIRVKVTEIRVKGKNPNDALVICKTMQDKVLKIKAIKMLEAQEIEYM